MDEKTMIYADCIRKWGLDSQIIMLAEETLELSHATLGLLRASKQKVALKNLAEEIVDAEFMIDEIKAYFGSDLQQWIDYWKPEKLKRLKDRLKDD